MSTPRFDLVDIAQTIQKRKMFVILISLLAAACALVFYLAQPKTYKAQTEMIPANPRLAERSNLYSKAPVFVDYYADEDDIDKVLGFANSEIVRSAIISKTDLAQTYKLDPSKPADEQKLSMIFQKNYNVKRTEFKNVIISFTDKDPQRAALVANTAAHEIEAAYRGYYNEIKNKMCLALNEKIRLADSMILSLTDTLATLRDHYKIYDIMAPSRMNITTVGAVKNTGVAGLGRGIEDIQSLEAIKDEYVISRSENISLLNQFTTGTGAGENMIPFIKIISEARPPLKPAGLGLALTVVAGTFLGCFLSIIVVLLGAYYKALVSVER